MRQQLTKYQFLIRTLAKLPPGNKCLKWPYALKGGGYGGVWIPHLQKIDFVHRQAFEINCGPIPKGLFVAHRCDCKICFRPSHVFLATPSANMQDCIAKGRDNRTPMPGERHPLHKLTEQKISKIRDLYQRGWTQRELAQKYRVCSSNIHLIVKGKTWRHLKLGRLATNKYPVSAWKNRQRNSKGQFISPRG